MPQQAICFAGVNVESFKMIYWQQFISRISIHSSRDFAVFAMATKFGAKLAEEHSL